MRKLAASKPVCVLGGCFVLAVSWGAGACGFPTYSGYGDEKSATGGGTTGTAIGRSTGAFGTTGSDATTGGASGGDGGANSGTTGASDGSVTGSSGAGSSGGSSGTMSITEGGADDASAVTDGTGSVTGGAENTGGTSSGTGATSTTAGTTSGTGSVSTTGGNSSTTGGAKDGGTGAIDAAADTKDAGAAIAWRAYLPLATGNAGVTRDASTFGYDATYSGSTITFSNSAMNLTGSTQELVEIAVKNGVPVIDTTKSYSVSVWVNMSSTSGYRTFVSADGTDASAFYLQKRGDSGKLAFTLSSADSDPGATPADGGQGACIVSSGNSAAAGALYHLVATRDRSTGTNILYVNGVEAGRATCTSPGWTGTGVVSIGHGMFTAKKTDFVAGAVSGVGLIDRVLTPAEVASLYVKGPAYSP